MAKFKWLAVAFGAGIALGMVAHAFFFGGNVESSERLERAAAQARRVEAAALAPAPDQVSSEAVQRPRVSDGPPATGVPGAEPAVALALDDAAQPQQPPYRDSMAIMHDEFLQEPRDDAWAYAREIELENTLVVETSMGSFRKDRIECRATMCEVHVSASGDQIPKMQKWFDDLNADNQRYSLNAPLSRKMSSFGSDSNNEAKASFLFVKPERMMPRPRQN